MPKKCKITIHDISIIVNIKRTLTSEKIREMYTIHLLATNGIK